jgi:hypothetical protein
MLSTHLTAWQAHPAVISAFPYLRRSIAVIHVGSVVALRTDDKLTFLLRAFLHQIKDTLWFLSHGIVHFLICGFFSLFNFIFSLVSGFFRGLLSFWFVPLGSLLLALLR